MSYFLTSEGQCKLTLMIADKARGDQDESSVAQAFRLAVMVDAGKTARLDAADSKAIMVDLTYESRTLHAFLSYRKECL